MRIEAAPVTNTTNFDGETFEGKLNAAKLSSVMDILIRNYHSAELATLREWISNAHDSHVISGQTKPVKVTLPSKFSPNLIVEDFGVGMSYDEVRDVYATFLNSTKDQDNDGIGGFGIGGKSALAIADQYTMVSIKDGKKNVFLFERSSKTGLDVKTAVRDQPTEEPNGVKVSVATSKNWNYQPSQINAVLEGWRDDQIELTNGDFSSFYSKSLDFEHGLLEKSLFAEDTNQHYGTNQHYWSRSTPRVFVGPVAYTIPEQAFRDIRENTSFRGFVNATNSKFAIKVPIGDVTFPSSREVIEPSDRNIQVLVEAFEKFYHEVEAYVNERAITFKNIDEAYKFATSAFVKNSKMTIVYDGRQLTNVTYKGVKVFHIENHGNADIKLYEDKLDELPNSQAQVIVRLTEDEAELSSETYKKYMRSAITDHYMEFRKTAGYRATYNILLTTETDDLHQVTSKIFEFKELRKTPVPRSSSGGARITDAEALSRANRERGIRIVGDTLENVNFGDFATEGKKVILLRQDDDAKRVARVLTSLLGLSDRVFIAASKRSIITIQRAYPDAVLMSDFITTVSKNEIKEAQSRLDEIHKLLKLMEFSRNTEMNLKTMVSQNLLTETTLSILKPELTAIADDIQSALTRYRYAKKDYTDSYAILKNNFDTEKIEKARYYSDRQGPFTLVSLRGLDNLNEVAAYLNWSAERYLAAKA